VIEKDVNRRQPLYPGQVMFPTAHDIVPENLDACITVIKNLLHSGNRVLIVSKPHLDCVVRLCSEFAEKKDSILFRFTITARNDKILSHWEPYAPTYDERKACLKYAHNQDFATSVSVEPMLDTSDVVLMVHELLPFVSHSIWLGKMNRIDKRVVCDSEEMKVEIDRIANGQSDEKIKRLHKELCGVAKVRWKESVKEVVGLPPAEEVGLDI